MSRHIRYLGFVVHAEHREYTLALRATDADATWHQVAILLSHDAFLSHRVRYQDAPDICFRILHQEAGEACEDWKPPESLWVRDEDLVAYSAAMAPRRPAGRHPRPAPESEVEPERA